MHPMISFFPSKQFYDAELEDGPRMEELRTELWHSSQLFGPYRFFNVQGRESTGGRTSLVNIMEIDTALMLYQRLTADFPEINFDGKVGIITPYKQQLNEMKKRFQRTYGDRIIDTIDFNTTDAFQGRERDIIIFSCVRASPEGGIGFLSDIRRMNVGLTRAKSSLYVLGNANSLVRNKLWGALVQDAKVRGVFTEGTKQLFAKTTRGKGAASQLSITNGSTSNQKHPSAGNVAPTAPVVRTNDPDPMDIDKPEPLTGPKFGNRHQGHQPGHNSRGCFICGQPGHRQTDCPQNKGSHGGQNTHAQNPRAGKGYGGSRATPSTHDIKIPTVKATSTEPLRLAHAPKRQHSYDANADGGNKRPHLGPPSGLGSGPGPAVGPSSSQVSLRFVRKKI